MTWTLTPLIAGPLGSNSYTYPLTGLDASSKYCYRAYFIVDGIQYFGNILSGTTAAIPLFTPTGHTGLASNITTSSFDVTGNYVIDKGGAPVNEYGILYTELPYWGTESNLIYENYPINVSKASIYSDINTGITNSYFTYPTGATSLSPNTTIYYRAFAKTSFDNGYGEIKTVLTEPYVNYTNVWVERNSFTPNSYSDGCVCINPALDVTQTFNIRLLINSGAVHSCYSEVNVYCNVIDNPTPILSLTTTSVDDVTCYCQAESVINIKNEDTLCYTNCSTGDNIYGSFSEFSILEIMNPINVNPIIDVNNCSDKLVFTPIIFSLSSCTATNITSASFDSGGYAMIGWESIDYYGTCYCKVGGIAWSGITCGYTLSGDNYPTTVPHLLPNTTYSYYACMVDNSYPMFPYYGQTCNVTTLPVAPTVTTGYIYSATTTSYRMMGNEVDTNGGVSINEYGIVYSSINPDPICGVDVNVSCYGNISLNSGYTINLIDLEPNTSTYYRAFAKNSGGIGYGISCYVQSDEIGLNRTYFSDPFWSCGSVELNPTLTVGQCIDIQFMACQVAVNNGTPSTVRINLYCNDIDVCVPYLCTESLTVSETVTGRTNSPTTIVMCYGDCIKYCNIIDSGNSGTCSELCIYRADANNFCAFTIVCPAKYNDKVQIV